MSVHVPHFEEKFQYLFRRHPAIKTYSDLAEAVGVSPALVAGWKNGTVTTRERHIPIRHVGTVCEHMMVSEDVLQLASLADFKAQAGVLPGANPFDALVLKARSSSRLQLLRGADVRERPALIARTRGLYDPDDAEADLPVFERNEDVLVRLEVPAGWHVLLLLKDRVGWQCLHPSPRRAETLADGVFFFPAQQDPDRPRFARFDAVTGLQKLTAVLMRPAPPPELRSALMDSDALAAALTRLATMLSALDEPDEREIAEARFMVRA
ncbi:MAG: hypothetical protein GY873_02560 [Bosea sp.]|uniref:hypothetical protein n=1 Tax=Bosea sp. (in: a-proteobacteria) TaxID=1871050 RepID=UPI0023947DA3|nr:hypothetical protein [Bosea sp. (in: a-proteobacteria)]MCP4733051.1 hypothetical protein [Bosea sp. (in: a-proteobacteria)]